MDLKNGVREAFVREQLAVTTRVTSRGGQERFWGKGGSQTVLEIVDRIISSKVLTYY